jgi:hypothetical protein
MFKYGGLPSNGVAARLVRACSCVSGWEYMTFLVGNKRFGVKTCNAANAQLQGLSADMQAF